MIFQIVTLFPEKYQDYLKYSLPARAHEKDLFSFRVYSLREYADPGRMGRIDEPPYGGGPGMVVQVGPVYRALEDTEQKLPVVLFTPRGEKLTQKRVREFSLMKGFTLVPGFYEGVDERVATHLADYQISIGDFVLNSGDLAALCFIESITRLLPGYMGSENSGIEESNEGEGLLEYPQYTRPADFNGWKVPEVLLSGNHAKIDQWRAEQSRMITEFRRKEQK
jgi:tRNA (guanine37-N1)-methyltransferase